MTDLFFQTKEPDTDNDDLGIIAPTDEDPAEEPIEEESDLKEDGITDDEDELE